VDHCGIAGDDEIQIHHYRSGIQECTAAFVEAWAQRFDSIRELDCRDLLDTESLLQRNHAHARYIAQHAEFTQWDRTTGIDGTALPANPDFEAVSGQALSPCGHAVGLGREKGRGLWHGFGRDPEDAEHADDRDPADPFHSTEGLEIADDVLHPGNALEQRLQARVCP